MNDIIDGFSIAASYMINPITAAYALAAIGLNIHFGYTGLLNFGQAGFMAVGAYGFAIPILSFGAPMIVGLICAISASVLLAIILGIPTLRLRADYLAIVTIASAEIIRLVVTSTAFVGYTGGANGLGSAWSNDFYAMNPLPDGRYGFGPWVYTSNGWWVRLVAWSLVAIAALLVWQLSRSPWGRVLKGIREDEDAVRSLGKSVYSYKMQALIFGGILGSLAGIILVLPRAIVPSQFGTQLTFFTYTILILGGAATVFGPILGSVLFWSVLLLSETLVTSIIESGATGGFFSTSDVGQLRFIIVGVALMLLVIFRPQGLLGNKKELSFSG